MSASCLELTRTQSGLVWTFNREWEFIHVLRRPPLAHAGTMLVPVGFQRHGHTHIDHHDERDLHDLGKVLWREMDPETGVACELMTMDAFFSHRPLAAELMDMDAFSHYPNHANLVGLRFRYTRAMERQFGCCTAGLNTTMESVEFGSDKVTYFERRRNPMRLLAVSVPCPRQDPTSVCVNESFSSFLPRARTFEMRL